MYPEDIRDLLTTPSTSVTKIRNDASYWTHKEMVYIQQMMWTRYNLQIGLKNQYYSLSPRQYYSSTISRDFGSEVMSGDYVGAFMNFEVYSIDNKFFPSKGVEFRLNYVADLVKVHVPAFRPIQSAGLDFRFVVPFGDRVALIPDIHLRTKVNNNPQILKTNSLDNSCYSLAHMTYLGGFMPDRYIEGQVPYFGINHTFFAGDQLASANAAFRVRVSNNYYFSLKGASFYSTDFIRDIFDRDLAQFDYAFGLEAGFNSLIGPLRADIHWDKSVGWGAFISLGYDF